MPDVILIDDPTVKGIINNNLELVKEAGLEALRAHYQSLVVAPNKQYLQASSHAHTSDRLIAMPAYLLPPYDMAGLKWIGSKPENFASGLSRAHALVILNDTQTHAPAVLMDGTALSSYRTLATTLISIDHLLLQPPRNVALLGMGKLGRMHIDALIRSYPSISSIRCFSRAPFDDLQSETVLKVSSPFEAIEGADLVVAVTCANQPYIGVNQLEEEVLLINLSLMDFDTDTFAPPTQVVVDDLNQCLAAKKTFKQAIEKGVLDPASVKQLSSLVCSEQPSQLSGRVLVNPLGMAVQDLMLARAILDRIDPESCPKFRLAD
jgi:N-[(2S)-2-amino-2-carboxyethyl]-L-glutamate dehydrogenase